MRAFPRENHQVPPHILSKVPGGPNQGKRGLTTFAIIITIKFMYEMKDATPFETDEDDFDTILASDITFSGNIRFAKPFMIKGKVNGNIEATSDLLVDSDAEINADIVADRILIRGKVKGNVKGYKLVYVAGSGSVEGDISSAQVVLEPGSHFSGQCTMTSGSEGIL
jgi:cytoskeletal protein CcmA (bactofilin family)